MKKTYNILKWVTFGVLLSSILFFFLPYMSSGDEGYSGFKILKESFDAGSWLAIEIIFRFVIPVILYIIGALLMFKASFGKTLATAILSFVAFLLNVYGLSQYLENNSESIWESSLGIGYYLNFIVAIVGIALPIVMIIIDKKSKRADQIEE